MVWLDSRGRSRKEPAGVLSAAGEGKEGSGVRGNSKGRWMAPATGKTGRGWDLCLPQGSLVIQQTVHSLATVREAGPFPGLVSTTSGATDMGTVQRVHRLQEMSRILQILLSQRYPQQRLPKHSFIVTFAFLYFYV